MMADYQVRLEGFEGPLDLLLHLIKKHEMDIMDIPIAIITGQYVESIERMKLLNLDLAGEFLLMAATLMHIKSKMLLPPDEVEEGEEEEGDPREELVRRLLEYKKYKEGSLVLNESDMLERENFLRGFYEMAEDESEEPGAVGDVTLFDLLEALKEVLSTVREMKAHEVELESVSVKEKVEMIAERVRLSGQITFQSLFDKDTTRGHVVATFLALLELIRTKSVKTFQGENFGAIRIMTTETVH